MPPSLWQYIGATARWPNPGHPGVYEKPQCTALHSWCKSLQPITMGLSDCPVRLLSVKALIRQPASPCWEFSADEGKRPIFLYVKLLFKYTINNMKNWGTTGCLECKVYLSESNRFLVCRRFASSQKQAAKTQRISVYFLLSVCLC